MTYWHKFIDYIKGSWLELKQVTWPTKNETLRFTLLVIFISIGTAIFLGGLDIIFTYLLEQFIL